MGVVVRKSSSEVVRPPPEAAVTTTNDISLSPIDKILAGLAVTIFLVFDDPIHEPAETIKKALSKALVHYLPISGRLATGPGPEDELRITAMGEGVPFVAAAASCSLKDANFLEQSPLVDELAIFYPAESCGLDDPLFMMQVTEFSCGGFVIGVTGNHAITDGVGLRQFLGAIGELARGLSSPSVVPTRSGQLLRGVSASTGRFMDLVNSLQPVHMATLDVSVPSRVISGIKEEYRRVHSNPCTAFEAVTALLWQCRTRAIGLSNPEDLVAIFFTVEARKYVQPGEGYYGNCLTGQLVVGTRDEVANGHLVDLVEMIQGSKSQIADQFDRNEGGEIADDDAFAQLVGYNLFMPTSWRNLGLEEVDFGGGRPVRVTRYPPKRAVLPECLICPGIDDDTNLVRSQFVTEEHAGAFLREVSSRFSYYIRSKM